MKPTKRLYRYACNNFNEVMHTTLNPEGPGVVRVHLIPPSYSEKKIASSVAIINGQDIIPVGPSFSVILIELIKEVNKFSGREIVESELSSLIDATIKNVKKVFPFVKKSTIRNDISRIVTTFKQVAYGEIPDEDIEYISMGDYARFMTAPHRMDLMVSAMTVDGKWHCNQKCLHCYAAGQKMSDEKELSTDEWKKILDICRRSKIPQVTFTGGEPTMREDLIDLISHAQWFVTRLNTNGIKLTADYCKKLMEASLDSAQITFYSHVKDIHNKLVGAEQYDNTVEGIENALKAGLNISINTPLCITNKDYVNTLRFLHEKGVTYVTCSGLIITGNATRDESERLQLSKDEIKSVLKEAVDFCYTNNMEISFTSPGWIENAYFDELGISAPTCGACLSNMAITPSGNVVPCQSWLDDDALGNILSDSWEKIWNNNECKIRRDYSAQMIGQCPFRENHKTRRINNEE